MKDKYQKYEGHDFYTNNYESGQVPLRLSDEFIQSMESITVNAEALFQWKKIVRYQNYQIAYQQTQWINKFGHNVDEDECRSSEDE